MRPCIAVLDACVLYPAPLRDLFMHLAITDLFRAKWTNEIHDEWIQNLLKNRPDLTLIQLNRTRYLMNLHAIDCLVKNYSDLIEKIELNDKDDRHVVAAAIKCQASLIITYNLNDFPIEILEKYSINAIHPDEFLCTLFAKSKTSVLKAIQKQRKNLRNPIITQFELIEMFEKINLNKLSEFLKVNIEKF